VSQIPVQPVQIETSIMDVYSVGGLTAAVINSAIDGKTDIGHTHSAIYYTKAEIDILVGGSPLGNIGIIVQDEGTQVHANAKLLNFVGDGVVVTVTGGSPDLSAVTITLTASGLIGIDDQATAVQLTVTDSHLLLATGKNFIFGTAALATTATDGFLYLSSMAGTPTGTPTNNTDTIPFTFDSTNGKLYFYDRTGSPDIGWTEISGAGGITDHTLLTNIGDNTHIQIDAHIDDSSIHFTEASISITESQVSNLQSYLLNITGEPLSDLSDVSITTLAAGEILVSSGSPLGWINQTLAEAGISATSHNHTGVYEPADATILKDADIGVTVQAYGAPLDDINTIGATTAADQFYYSTSAGVLALGTVTASGRALIDDANVADQRTTLGLVSGGTGDIWVEKAGDTMDSTANLTFAGGGEILGLPATPSTAGAAASKAYVDSVAVGLTWSDPIMDPDLVGVASANPATGSPLPTNDAVYIKYGGTQNETWGNITNVVDNDVMLYNTNETGDWLRLGVLESGTRFIIAGEHGTADSSLTSIGFKDGDIIEYDGSSNPSTAGAWSTPDAVGSPLETADGTTVLVTEANSYHYGHTYLYNASSNVWIEVSGPGSIGAGNGLYYDGNVLNAFDATTTVKGVASFNSSHFSVAAGAVSLASTLDDITDVTITSIASNEILKWSGSAWINNTLSEAGISATGHTHIESDITDLQPYLLNITSEPLSDLSDVSVTALGAGEVLVSSGSPLGWINNTLSEAGISATGHTHTESDITDLQSYLLNITGENIEDLANVTLVGSPAPISGDVLRWSGSAWNNYPDSNFASTSSLTSHTDDATIHFTEASISITESQVSNLQSYILNITGEPLSDLSDVSVTALGAGEVLLSSGSPLGWINQTLAEAGISATGHTHTESDITDLQSYILNITGEPLSDLSDVTIASITSNEILKWSGSAWINNTLAEAGISATGHTHTESDITDLQSYLLNITGEPLSDLSDATITSIASGELLKWSGSAWINNTLAEAGISATGHTHIESDITDLQSYLLDITSEPLSDLSDVSVSALGAGEILVSSGSPLGWVNQTLAEAGISATSHNHDATYVNVSGDTMTGDLNFGDGDNLYLGDSNEIRITHSGTDNFLISNVYDLYLQARSASKLIVMQAANSGGTLKTCISLGGATPSAKLFYDGSKVFETVSGGVRLADGQQVNLGNADDLSIYHDGTNSYVHNVKGSLYIDSRVTSGSMFLRTNSSLGGTYTGIRIGGTDPYVRLYYNNGERFKTTLTGVFITGKMNATAVDINGLSTAAALDGAADYVMIYDANFVSNRKVLLDDLLGLGVSTLDGLDDVSVSALSGGEVLVSSGSPLGWVNQTLAEAGISATGHTHTGVYEPAFSKNTGFNLNLGTSAGTVSEGDHTHTGVYEPADATILKDADIGVTVQAYSATNALTTDITYETLNTNGDVGTTAGTLAIGDHTHTGVYEPADGTILKDADIGVTIQAYDLDLTNIAALTGTSGFLKTDGANVWSVDTGVYEPADATILKDADIGVTVQAYDATYLVDADIGVTVQAYDATYLVDADIGVNVAAFSHNHTFDGLSNVTITSIASGEIPKWSGSAWINNTLAEAGISATGHNHDATYVNVSGDTMTGNLTVGSTTANNKLTMANPGIGNSSTIEFAKTSDSARIVVTENLSDQTEFQFYMADNPQSTVDKFNWFIDSWRGSGNDWKPLEFAGYDATIQGKDVFLRGRLSVGNTPYISTAGIYNDVIVIKTGTLTATFNVSGYTPSTQQQFYIEITTDGSTFSAWDRSTPTGRITYQTDVTITGGAQTVGNGITITFSGTSGGVSGDSWRLGVWPSGEMTSSLNITVDEATPTAIDHLTRKDYVDSEITALSSVYEPKNTNIQSHISDGTIHFTEASISITESQISNLQSYLLNITGEPLSDLSDVTITSITSNEILKWSGSAWINNTLAEAGIEPSFSKNTGFNKNLGTSAGTVSEGNHTHTGVYEPADATILKDADIGVNVQAYGAPLTAFPDPTTNDADALGVAGTAWGDLFLASGGVVDWASDSNITHSTGALVLNAPDSIQLNQGSGTRTFTINTSGCHFNTTFTVGSSETWSAQGSLEVVSPTNTRVNLWMKATASQTADYIKLVDSAEAEVAAIDPSAVMTGFTVNSNNNTVTVTESDISDLQSYLLNITAEPLSDLSDVSVSALGAGEILVSSGSPLGWINNTLAEAGISSTSHNHDATYVNVSGDTMTGILTLDDDLIFTNRVTTDGHIQLYQGTQATGYAIGVEASTVFYRSSAIHRWYLGTFADGGTSDYMELNTSGLVVVGDIEATTFTENGTLISAIYEPIFSKNTGFNKNFGTVAGTVSEGDHNHTLDSLSNTAITSIASGELLKWSGSAWINNTLAEAGISATSHNHTGVYEPADATILKDADIGVTVQAFGDALDDINTIGATTAINQFYYSTGAGVLALGTITSVGRALIDDASVSAQRTTLGLVAGGAGDIWVEKAGDSMSSAANITFAGGGEVLGLPATPTTAGSAASKAYVDSVAVGLSWSDPITDPDLVGVVSAIPTPVTDDTVYIKQGGTQNETWGNITNVVDNDVMLYNTNETGDWLRLGVLESGTRFIIAGEHGTAESSLTTIGFKDGDIIEYDGTSDPSTAGAWSTPDAVGSPLETADGTTVLVSNANSYHYGHTYLYDNLNNAWIEISGPGSINAGNGLYYDGNTLNAFDATTAIKGVASFNSNYFSVSAGAVSLAATLDDLTDVNITGIASNEILKWSGSAWINNTLAEAGISAASHNHDATYLGITAKAADAEKLDNLNSTQFLRSDAADTTTGDLTMSKSNARFNMTNTAGSADSKRTDLLSSGDKFFLRHYNDIGNASYNFLTATKSGHQNVSLALEGTDNNGLTWNANIVWHAGNFTPSDYSLTTHTHTLDGLTDTSVTALGAGEILVSSGSPLGWINNTLAEAGISATSHNHDADYVNVSGDTMTGDLTINGTLYATAKSFKIVHPLDEKKTLTYGSLEGPENGIYHRGTVNGDVIDLPDYWKALVDEDSITVTLTPRGKFQKLYVKSTSAEKITIGIASWFKGRNSIKCDYVVYAERNDISKLQVEE